jgi:phytoene synthase
MMETGLSHSYSYCERLARREAGNFYPSFRLLPPGQRRATCALYAFLRIADDLADGPGVPEQKEQALADWQHSLERALRGCYSHRLHPALHHAVMLFGIPRQYLLEVLDGIRMDLARVDYQTFADLYRYCYRVAAAVGLACIHIWGFTDQRALTFAESAGIAFQLTNILRDLGEDAARERIYLPRDELQQFGYPPEQLLRQEQTAEFRELMRFQVERARRYYDEALPLAPLLSKAGQPVFLALQGTYRGLLDTIEARNYDVFSSRVRLPPWRKVGILLRTLPVRLGLV